jgi:hypothetical protein
MEKRGMQNKNTVEIADRMSRKRAVVMTAAAIVFLGVQLIARPIFLRNGAVLTHNVIDWWAVNAILLMALLVTRLQGGLLNSREVRALINDDVSREHHRSGIVTGFWTAMIVAMSIYFLPVFAEYSSREAVYLIVTASVGAALLKFCWLELRAHRDA